MKLFVGLGNPGAKYEKTRHNIGFLAIDEIVRAHGLSPERSKFQALLSEGKIGTQKVFCLKPQTFMNLSGQSVGEAMRFFKLEPEDVVVFHDELDLAPGKLKVKKGGGHAGHNGLRSLHDHIGADFTRVRIGIGHPGDKRLVSGFELHDFAKSDWDWIDPLLEGIADGAPLLANDDPPSFMNKVSLRMQPPKATLKPAAGAPEKTPPEKPRAAETTPDQSPAREEDAQDPENTLSPLQRLAARFSRRT